jgi:hypothetical protein
MWSFTSNSNAFKVRLTSINKNIAERIIPIILRRNNNFPSVVRSK